MRITNLYIKTVVFFVILTASVYAQRIQNFNVFAAGSVVGVKFTISPGTSCSGYKIWHSLDSTYFGFNPIYDYPGICGASGTSEDVSYTHGSPAVNQVNYYKVELVPVETSAIRRVFVPIDQTKVKLFIYPNPIGEISDILSLKISNIGSAKLVGFLYNQFGHKLRELDLMTQFDLASINVYDLNDGLYEVWLTDGNQAYSSKFIVRR
ncbi:MAG: T9SS type A sorting domain-containing protein [Bacteroidota bacterium]|nr:T9SS type A sorting domain-containing protein [Bacteroidota bacterium]